MTVPNIMPLLIWLVPYLVCAWVFWMIVNRIAPSDRKVSGWLAIVTIFLMSLCEGVCDYFLEPLIGIFRFGVDFVALTLIVALVTDIPFSRSALTVLVYLLVMAAVVFAMRLLV